MSVEITMDATGAKELLGRLASLPEAAREETRAIAEDLLGALESTTPVRTGALLASERTQRTEDGARLIIGGGDVTYARPVAARTNFVEEAEETVLPEAPERMRQAVREHVEG